MNEVRDDVDEVVTLKSLNPPSFQGRTLEWSGERRVPAIGDSVCDECGTFGIVIGYWQTHGCLGVKIAKKDNGTVAWLLGSEIDLMNEFRNHVVNSPVCSRRSDA